MRKLTLLIAIIIIPVLLYGCVSQAYHDNEIIGSALDDTGSIQKNNVDNTVDNNNDNAETNVEPGITGYVVDKSNNRILVVSSEAKDFSSTGGVNEFYDAIWFSNVPEDVALGQKVKVWFDAVRESYPAQSEALKVEVIPSERPDGAVLSQSEALERVLGSGDIEIEYGLAVKSVSYDNQSKVWNLELKKLMHDDSFIVTVEDSLSSNSSDSQGLPLTANDDLQVGELKVDMPKESIDVLMKAVLVRNEKEDVDFMDSEFLYYDDETIIHLVDGKIYSITVYNENYTTPRGLKVGTSTNKLKQLYGEPSYINQDGIWVYSARGYDLFFVEVRDDIVVSIKVSLVM